MTGSSFQYWSESDSVQNNLQECALKHQKTLANTGDHGIMLSREYGSHAPAR